MLAGLGGFEVGDILAAGEERSHKRTGKLIEPVAGVLDHRPEQIGEAAVERYGEPRVEGRAGLIGGVVGHGKILLGGAHVGTRAEGLHGHASLVSRGQGQFDALGHGPLLRKRVQQKAHRVVELVEAHLEVGDGGEDIIIVCRRLHHGRLGDAAGKFEVAHRLDALLPQHGCRPRKSELLLHGGDGIVGRGYAADNLRAHGLRIGLAPVDLSLSRALAVEQLAENVDFPACLRGDGVGPRDIAPGIGCSGAVGREGYRRQVGQTRALQPRTRGVDIELSVAEVGVIGQRAAYEVLKHGVGEYLLPRQVAQGRRVRGRGLGLGVGAGKLRRRRRLELLVYMAAAQRGHRNGGQGRQRKFDYFVHLL